MRLHVPTAAAAFAASFVAAATLAAGAGAVPAAPAGFNACTALQSSFDAFWKSKVVTSPLANRPAFVGHEGRIYHCEWSKRVSAEGNPLDWDYFVTFNFSASRSVAEAKQFVALSTGNPKNKPVAGTGADEAYGSVTLHGGSIVWRKGRYAGALGMVGPELSGYLGESRDTLRAFIRRLPKS